MKKTPITIITGYLGSGKTTLMNNILASYQLDNIALIVNDIGSINIDSKLIKDTSNIKNEMIELQNGCICCTLRDEFVTQLAELANNESIDRILVEASGVSNPVSISEGLMLYQQNNPDFKGELKSIVTVVDASRIIEEFKSELEEYDDDKDPDIINLIVDQIEFCSKIILNKCDLVSKDELEYVKKLLRSLQNKAEIIECSNCDFDVKSLFEGEHFNFDEIFNSSLYQKALSKEKLAEDDFGITSFVYENKRPFNEDLLMNFFENNYPSEIIRAKGYIWFSDDYTHAFLFEQVGKNSSISEFSNWVDALDEQEKKLTIEDFPDILDDWDEKYGDRMNQIVFIGKNFDKEQIIADLDACLDE